MVDVDDIFEPDSYIDEEPLRPPWTLLAVAVIAVAVAAALFAVPVQAAHLAGYAVAGVLAVVCVAAYRFVDNRRRAFDRYRPSQLASRVAVAVLVLGWFVACGNAWLVATEWSK